ncbi:MAG: hypothetical protein FJ029_14690, partial [Actinobacteria bacterium]|nr:hypothetical protein [Actinomycetota bacterium]
APAQATPAPADPAITRPAVVCAPPAAATAAPAKGWAAITPSTRPPARRNHTLTFVPALASLLLFGGRAQGGLQDTWLFHVERGEWTPVAGPGPAARWGHAAAADPRSGRVMLWGGQTPSGFLDDLWSFDPARLQWSQVKPASPLPLKRYGHGWGMTPAGVFYISHGFTAENRFDDTWALAGDQFSDVSPPGAQPLKRCLHQCVWDVAKARLVLFMGQSNAAPFQGDVWAYDPGARAWTELQAATKPSPRHFHAAVYEPARGVSVVLGGLTAGGDVADVWVLDRHDTWSALNLGTGPSARNGHAATVHPATGIIYVFGGLSGGNPTDDLWALDLG